jgi:uncharacterized small protein (DUF1192 family)
MGGDSKEVNALKSSHLQAELYRSGSVDSAGGAFPEPRIAYSAELAVVTKEFAHSRSSLEEILERHRGYVAKLRMVGQPSGSVLSAILRVPSSEYRSALTELKAVGFVEHEEEAADEITQQHGELEARLINAQNEEQRIQRLLHDRAEKVYDYGSLERQVALLRTEIERIESERVASGSRVSFANVSFSLREERTPVAECVRKYLRHPAFPGRPRPPARPVGRDNLFPSTLLLASPLPVGPPGSRSPQEFVTHPPGDQAESIDTSAAVDGNQPFPTV